MRLRSFLFLPLVSVCCLASDPSLQTSNSNQQGPVPVFRTHSHAVVVDVVVTRGDQPINGLHK